MTLPSTGIVRDDDAERALNSIRGRFPLKGQDIATNAITASQIGSLPAARVFNTTGQSIPNNAFTALTFDSERFDTDTIHSTSSNTSRLTATTAGVYIINATLEFGASAVGIRATRLLLNGATEIAFENTTSGATFGDQLTMTTIYKFAATDYVECQVFQNSGGALAMTVAGNKSVEFSMAWQGDG